MGELVLPPGELEINCPECNSRHACPVCFIVQRPCGNPCRKTGLELGPVMLVKGCIRIDPGRLIRQQGRACFVRDSRQHGTPTPIGLQEKPDL